MCVNIIYVCTCLYCVICLILYYRSLLICTNKEFMKTVFNDRFLKIKTLIVMGITLGHKYRWHATIHV